MPAPPSERSLAAKAAIYARWATTAPARATFDERFAAEVGPRMQRTQ